MAKLPLQPEKSTKKPVFLGLGLRHVVPQKFKKYSPISINSSFTKSFPKISNSSNFSNKDSFTKILNKKRKNNFINQRIDPTCPIMSKNRFAPLRRVSINDTIDVRYFDTTLPPKHSFGNTTDVKRISNKKPKNSKKIENDDIIDGSINTVESSDTSNITLLPNPDSVLPFVKIKLGYGKDNLKPHINCLADTGATHSILNLKIFKQIPNYEALTITDKETATILTASNQKVQTVSRALIPLTFTDQLGHKHTIRHVFFIIDNIPHNGILGSDILLNDDVMRGFHSSYINLIEPRRRLKLIRIPLCHMNTSKSIELCTTNVAIIEPGAYKFLEVKSSSEVPYSTQLLIEEFNAFENDTLNTFQVIPTVQRKKDNDIYKVLIKNDSNQYFRLDPETPIATIMPQTESINFVQAHSFSDILPGSDTSSLSNTYFAVQPCSQHNKLNKIVDYPRLNTFKLTETETSSENLRKYSEKQLDKNDDLTPQEKSELIEQLEVNGFYPHSPTTMMNKQSNLETEIKEDTPVMSSEQILSKIDLEHIPKENHEFILNMLKENIDVFSKNEFDIPACPLEEADPELKDDFKTTCLNCRYQPIPINLRDAADKAIFEMTQAGIIGPIDDPSPVISNLLITKKKNGKPRFCLDLRLINQATKKAPIAMTPLQEVFQSFANSTHHTAIDLSNSFFSIPIKRNKVPLFSFFDSKRRRYAFFRCPQGYKNSNFHLSNALNKALQGIDNVYSYCDDLTVSTNGTIFDHIAKINEVLYNLKIHNFKIKAEKVQLLKPTIDILGFTFANGRFSIPVAKANAFLNYPLPNSQKKLKSFICAASYYRRLIPRFADKTYNLQQLLKLDHRQFKYTEEAKADFLAIRNEIASSTAGFYPVDHNKPLYLSSDASNNCCSFVLWYKDDQDKDCFVSASSRLFTTAERNYSTFKKEVVSVLFGLSSLDSLLRFAKRLVLYVDARSILFLRAAKASSPILMRFALAMSNYDLEIVHIAGKDHILPDVLSRSLQPNCEPPVTPMNEKEATALLNQLTLPNTYNIDKDTLRRYLLDDGLPSLSKSKQKKLKTTAKITDKDFKPQMKPERKIKMPRTTQIHPFYREQQRQLYEQQPDFGTKDSLLNAITIQGNQAKNDISTLKLNAKVISDGIISLDLFKESQLNDGYCQSILNKPSLPESFTTRKNILIRVVKGVEKLVLPVNLIPLLVSNLHFSLKGRHNSKSNMLEEISELYFCPKLDQKLKEITEGCILCKLYKTSSQKQHKFGQKQFPKTPRSEYFFDICCGLPNSEGYKYIYIFVDAMSLYTILVPAKNREGHTIRNAFQNNVVLPFLKPKRLYGDNESALFSNTMRNYCEENDIELMSCSPHSPFSNSTAEKTVHLTKETLRVLTAQTGESWTKLLPVCVNSLNTRRLKTNISPEKLFFGQSLEENPLLSVDTVCNSEEEYFKILKENISENTNKHLVQRNKNAAASRDYLNRSRTHKEFSVGQLVMLKNFSIAHIEGGGLQKKFLGPYKILDIESNRQTCLLQDIQNNSTRRAHLMHLQNFEPSGKTALLMKTPLKNEAASTLRQYQGHNYNLRNKRKD